MVLYELSLQLCIIKLVEFLEYVARVAPTLEAVTTWRGRITHTGVLRLVLRVKKYLSRQRIFFFVSPNKT